MVTRPKPIMDEIIPSMLSRTQAAHALHVSTRTIDNLMAAKSISYIRVNRAVRFEVSAIEAYKKANRVNAVA
jgi:excisionase family DNA binding protein